MGSLIRCLHTAWLAACRRVPSDGTMWCRNQHNFYRVAPSCRTSTSDPQQHRLDQTNRCPIFTGALHNAMRRSSGTKGGAAALLIHSPCMKALYDNLTDSLDCFCPLAAAGSGCASTLKAIPPKTAGDLYRVLMATAAPVACARPVLVHGTTGEAALRLGAALSHRTRSAVCSTARVRLNRWQPASLEALRTPNPRRSPACRLAPCSSMDCSNPVNACILGLIRQSLRRY